jgi:succinyl-CoA synthetase beta subunit
MRVIEAEAKAMLARRGLATPRPSKLYAAGETVEGWTVPVAIKAQTLSGKRAEAGLIQLAQGNEAPAVVARIGEDMRRIGQLPVVLVEAQVDIAAEYYLAWRVDDVAQCYVMMVSSAGGSDIEERAATVHHYAHSPLRELQPFHLAATMKAAGIPTAHIGACARFAVSLLVMFKEEDATLLEINPLVVTSKGSVMAVDAKLVLDDSGDKRHLDHAALVSNSLQTGEQTELEAAATQAGFTFVELNGPVAVYSAGAGLGMCLLDMLADAGTPAANFADASGGSSAEVFARMGQVVFSLAERDDVEAILFFFVLAATSLKSVVDGILHLIDNNVPPKPLVIGLIAAGAAERELTLAEAQRLIGERGFPCVTDLGEAVAAIRDIVRTTEGAQL